MCGSIPDHNIPVVLSNVPFISYFCLSEANTSIPDQPNTKQDVKVKVNSFAAVITGSLASLASAYGDDDDSSDEEEEEKEEEG